MTFWIIQPNWFLQKDGLLYVSATGVSQCNLWMGRRAADEDRRLGINGLNGVDFTFKHAGNDKTYSKAINASHVSSLTRCSLNLCIFSHLYLHLFLIVAHSLTFPHILDLNPFGKQRMKPYSSVRLCTFTVCLWLKSESCSALSISNRPLLSGDFFFLFFAPVWITFVDYV